MKLHLTIILLSLLPLSAICQEKAIETDRPDQTENTSTVPSGHFQMENGFTHTENRDEDELMLPSSLWKFGLGNGFEVRLTTELQYDIQPSDNLAGGLKPITAGFKVKLWEEKGALPETSFIGEVKLPKTGASVHDIKHLGPELQLLFLNTLSNNFGIGYNLDAIWDGNQAQPRYEYTLSPEYEFPCNIRVFAEVFGYMENHGNPDHWADAGFKYLLNDNIQVDFAGGYELSSHNHYHSFYETLGFSFRI